MRSLVVFGISPRFRGLSQSPGQVAHVLLTRSPLEYPRKGLSARLACVKHAASVRPEPGSNSPTKTCCESIPATKKLPKESHQTNKPSGRGINHNWHWLIKHPVEFSKNNRTPSNRSAFRGPFSGALALLYPPFPIRQIRVSQPNSTTRKPRGHPARPHNRRSRGQD